jgi:hypothetical protein
MTSGAGRTDVKGGGRRNPKIITTVIRVLGYLGLGRGETMERRIVERKEELSYLDNASFLVPTRGKRSS